jgi:hypothetical protein
MDHDATKKTHKTDTTIRIESINQAAAEVFLVTRLFFILMIERDLSTFLLFPPKPPNWGFRVETFQHHTEAYFAAKSAIFLSELPPSCIASLAFFIHL